jgi:mono/diheme cytochrome c family protein
MAEAVDADVRAKGEYVFNVAGCQACHTDTEHKGAALAGGHALQTPFGIFYPPNITPDMQSGLGRWQEADFIRALSEGISPEGKYYYPVFPYPSYTRMSRTDMHALWVYLRSLPPVAQANKPYEISWYLFRIANRGWQWVFFQAGAWQDDAKQSAAWNRGGYLANALTHCGECHTPRNSLGVLDKNKAFAGTQTGPEGAVVPNITSDKETGIGGWSRHDLLEFMDDGGLPDGDYVGGLMAEVVDNGLKRLHKDDAEALATYIAALPPVTNLITKKKAKK